MGIPSYYTYLIKNFNKLIQKKTSIHGKINNFYLDSNSIIYDCLYNMEVEVNMKDFENKLIRNVCLKIDEYIKQVCPDNLVYISFDGIAPVAKLKQQKERRYKSMMMDEIYKEHGIVKHKMSFNKAKITPGTQFMKKLDKRVSDFFKDREKLYGINKIIFSGSKERGEGEHKIFDYIRNNQNSTSQTAVIYGLDADLIIIGLNNLNYVEKLYLFRETPEFIKSIKANLEVNSLYFMNINNLRDMLLEEMTETNIHKLPIETKNSIIKDYVFLMMFMGNDFMPHFPSLNIRTSGLHQILDIYKLIISSRNARLVSDSGVIDWKYVRELIEKFKELEYDNIKREYRIRDKMEDKISKKNNDVLEQKITNIPICCREDEKYINPFIPDWESRYYETLLKMDRNNKENVEKICINYLEGLEWNMLYYTNGCKNWSWKYNFAYPPLFVDLLKYTPIWEVDMIQENDENITNIQQLAYVLPIDLLGLIPKKERDIVEKYRKSKGREIGWSYCRYLWEAHIDFIGEDFKELCGLLQ